MFMNKAFVALLGATSLVCQVSSGETRTYSCGKNLAALISSTDQRGPLFAVGNLIFTSLKAEDHSQLLLVNSGSGAFVLRLKSSGLNRIRFQIPGLGGRPGHTYYLSYMHGDRAPSRFFEAGEDRAPLGHEVMDYQLTSVTAAEHLESHLIFAIQKTAQAMASGLNEGRLTRGMLQAQSLQDCQALVRRAPALAKNLKVLKGHSTQTSAQRPFKRAKTTNSLARRASVE